MISHRGERFFHTPTHALPLLLSGRSCLRGVVAPDPYRREQGTLPSMPLWRFLVTRVVKPKSAEAWCPGANAAMKKELHNMNSKKVWEVDDVYSLKDLLR